MNRLVDALVHPLAKENPYIMILDGVLHGIVEQKPSASTIKFIKYNLPRLLEQLAATHVEQRSQS